MEMVGVDPKEFSFTTPWPSGYQLWALFATEGAISDAHQDAAGFLTILQMEVGEKIWYIGVPKPGLELKTVTAKDGWIVKNFDWQMVVLRQGDTLFVPSNLSKLIYTNGSTQDYAAGHGPLCGHVQG